MNRLGESNKGWEEKDSGRGQTFGGALRNKKKPSALGKLAKDMKPITDRVDADAKEEKKNRAKKAIKGAFEAFSNTPDSEDLKYISYGEIRKYGY
jgi:hypothetical protein